MAKSTPGSRDPNALPTGVESTKGSGVGGGGFKSAEEEMEWLMEKAKGAGTLSANEQARVMKAINTSFRDSRLFLHFLFCAGITVVYVFRVFFFFFSCCICVLLVDARAHVARDGQRRGARSSSLDSHGWSSVFLILFIILERRMCGTCVSVPQVNCG
jgi:hypothetical protein